MSGLVFWKQQSGAKHAIYVTYLTHLWPKRTRLSRKCRQRQNCTLIHYVGNLQSEILHFTSSESQISKCLLGYPQPKRSSWNNMMFTVEYDPLYLQHRFLTCVLVVARWCRNINVTKTCIFMTYHMLRLPIYESSGSADGRFVTSKWSES